MIRTPRLAPRVSLTRTTSSVFICSFLRGLSSSSSVKKQWTHRMSEAEVMRRLRRIGANGRPVAMRAYRFRISLWWKAMPPRTGEYSMVRAGAGHSPPRRGGVARQRLRFAWLGASTLPLRGGEFFLNLSRPFLLIAGDRLGFRGVVALLGVPGDLSRIFRRIHLDRHFAVA